MIREHDCVVLTQDLPDEGLQTGDIGTVVHIYQDGAGSCTLGDCDWSCAEGEE